MKYVDITVRMTVKYIKYERQCTTMTEINVLIHAVWSVFVVRTKKLCTQSAHSDDSDQTANAQTVRMRILILIFAGHTWLNLRFRTTWFKCMNST